jgi:mRNA-degrading endonuclease RelE of RelBE toxin-antitoxin system
MPQVTCAPREIRVGPSFQRDIRAFSATHPIIHELIVSSLVNEIGPNPNCGMAIPGWASRVFKLRIADKCHNLGKSNGFRLIYDWEPASRTLWLLRLYTHAQIKGSIADKEVQKIRKEAGVS